MPRRANGSIRSVVANMPRVGHDRAQVPAVVELCGHQGSLSSGAGGSNAGDSAFFNIVFMKSSLTCV